MESRRCYEVVLTKLDIVGFAFHNLLVLLVLSAVRYGVVDFLLMTVQGFVRV